MAKSIGKTPFAALSLIVYVVFHSAQGAAPAAPAPAPVPASESGPLVNAVIGNVGKRVVTLREVRINALLEHALYPQQKEAEPGNPKPEAGPVSFESPEQISRTLVEWAVYLEAQTFKAVTPKSIEIKAAERAALAAIAGKAELRQQWDSLAVTEAEMSEMVDRKVRARALVDFRSSASRVVVSDAEALRYFQKNKSRFGDRPFSQFKETIRAYLAQSQSDSRMRSWFESLRQKHSVKLVGKLN